MTHKEPTADLPQMETQVSMTACNPPSPAPCPPVAESPAPQSPARRPGGQPSNGNAIKTAWRAKLPKLAKSAKSAEEQVYGLRVALLGSLKRPPTLAEQLLVQSICRQEVIAQNCFAWLRREGDAMPLADRLQVTAVLSRAEEARAKLIARFGLKPKTDADAVDDTLAALDAIHRPPQAAEPA